MLRQSVDLHNFSAANTATARTQRRSRISSKKQYTTLYLPSRRATSPFEAYWLWRKYGFFRNAE